MHAPAPKPAIPPAFFGETVTWVHHWTDRLFSFRCTRDPALRFVAGQFAMIGLMVNGKPLVRAYSMVSPPWDEELEFLSIKVQDGPLTSRLQHIQPGDTVLIGKKPTGTLLTENLLPGKTLWFLATGTGLAPFMSLIREPEVYEKYERVVLCHTVREVKELAYRDTISKDLPEHEFLGEMLRGKLIYYPSVTREPFPVQGRITTLIESGKVFADLGLPAISPERDRVMICGSEALNADVTAMLEARGFVEGNNSKPGTYVVEKAFVTK
ncbi:ferredoxin--NADP reductase [Siccirubricoccus sp. KC 17139]|uniref:ferredoxin--NADP(+) reductase n=1 Tax=Siccirubricoccus soli TaxID=2899147 RepID=A0ABT1D420_9PROT|nr:ferredoxin--NADP reductase [Siccirubricoccus soli]MCO6416668.1 ferredoxin--NADP reductase [Siccirubricoccus soli]MCP2682803.1 ferredoxin--NADP reductase [Siccirubricoccus soli]